MANANGSGSREGQNVSVVHDRLRAAIVAGDLAAGRATSQVTLARELGVGRTPLREALRMLQREGLVISEPNRRVRIAELSSSDAEQLYIMRFALEGVAARITVPTLSSDDFAELEGYMAMMDHYMRADNYLGMRAPHRAFHLRFVGGAGQRVSGLIGDLFDHAERYRRAFGATSPGDGWDQRRAEHRAIIEAAATGDVDLTVRCLIAHYARTIAVIFEALDPEHDLARLRTAVTIVAPGAESALDV
jgi:DNA-binding GntR family transcriptional regulator